MQFAGIVDNGAHARLFSSCQEVAIDVATGRVLAFRGGPTAATSGAF